MCCMTYLLLANTSLRGNVKIVSELTRVSIHVLFLSCERSIVIIEMGETILVSNNINFYEYMLLLHASECQALNLCCPYSECLYHFNVHYIYASRIIST